MVEPLKNRDGSTMLIIDRSPGDVVVVLDPRPRIVVVGSILGLSIDRKGRRRGDAHGVLLRDVDPETMRLVARDDVRRHLRRWYSATGDLAVVAVVETIDHRRAMQHLRYTRKRLLSVSRGYDFGTEYDPIRSNASTADVDVPF